MAATFKIHIDEPENVSVKAVKDFKETIHGGKRQVLGELQNKYIPESNRHNDLKWKDIPKGFTETIKALDIQDKPVVSKCNYVSPVKDIWKPISDSNGHSSKYIHSEQIAIDTSPILLNEANLKEDDSQKSDIVTPTKSLEDSKQVDIFSKLELYGCSAYHDAIYKYLRKIAEQFRPKSFYMRRQPDITYSMRTILIDWLVEVGEEFKLHNETLFRAVSYIDRFLSSMAVARPKLQLLGTSAMFIATKFEEIDPPEVGEFAYITDDSYTTKQVLRMERLILKVLCFDLSSPTAYTFLLHIASKSSLPSKVFYLAMYICELTLLEADPYLDFCPSLIACGAIAVARHCLGCVDVWSSNLIHITQYTLPELSPVISHLNETHFKSFTLPQIAIRQKYKTAKYEYVSQIPFKRLSLRESFIS